MNLGGRRTDEQRTDESKRYRKARSVILVYLSGGLAHQDTFDLKPDAPEKIRGEFRPIATSVPGILIGDLLPKLAQCMDKVALLRAVVGQRDEHSSFQNLTGFPMDQSQRDRKPHFGAVISRVLGRHDPIMPSFIDLFPTMQHRPYNSSGPGYLGQANSAMKLNSDDLSIMRHEGIPQTRTQARRSLLQNFDDLRRGWEPSPNANPYAGLDECQKRAFEVLNSGKVADALDLSKEDPRLRERYGVGSSQHLGDGAPMWNDQLLIARRLAEAGARCVTVAYGFWDTHGNNFGHLKRHLPLFDQGVSALINDIHSRGLQDEIMVVVCGEFGRTPLINKDAGRDHWARVNSALISGGGLQMGQAIGATDKTAGSAVSGQVHYQDILATIYHTLGIDPHGYVTDPTNRPMNILPSTVRVIERLT